MNDFDFLDQLRRLSPEAQERFKRVVNRLFAGDLISPGTDPLASDPDWRFMERHRDIVAGYLRCAGWEIEDLPAHRMYRAVHAGGAHKVQVTVLESMIACILRQAYHAHMANPGSGERRCEIETGELRERLAQARRSSTPDTRKSIATAVKRLRRFGLLEVNGPYQGEDHEVIVVSPLIETVLSMEKVQAFWANYEREMRTASTPVSAGDHDDSSMDEEAVTDAEVEIDA